MRIEASRRDVLLGMGAASLGGLTAGLAGSRPARAGVGWGPGPNSGLPFWLGGHGDYVHGRAMMPGGRSVDIGMLVGNRTAIISRSATRDPGPWAPQPGQHLPEIRPCQRRAMDELAVLQRLDLRGAERLADQRGRRHARTIHLNCSRPPTFAGNEDRQRRSPSSGGSGRSRPTAGLIRSGGPSC